MMNDDAGPHAEPFGVGEHPTPVRIQIILKLLEVAAVGLPFGGSILATPDQRFRLAGLASAAVLAAVTVMRGLLWGWTMLHLGLILLAVMLGFFAARQSRSGTIVITSLYMLWIAQRGY